MPTPDGSIAIAVAIPHGRDVVSATHMLNQSPITHQEYVHPLTGQRVVVWQEPFRIIGEEYARGRNDLVRMILASEKDINWTFDYILWMDDDTLPPADVIPRLLKVNTRIASGLYFQRKLPYMPVAYRATNDPLYPNRFWVIADYPKDTYMEVDAVGFGCMLIDTEVFRKLPQPWFRWEDTPDIEDFQSEESKRFADPYARWDHRSIGEDLYFCKRARAAGYRIILDTGTLVGHIGESVVTSAFFDNYRHAYYRVAPPERLSICFVTPPAPKPWDGSFISSNPQPLGGTESSIAYLARALAKRHHVVSVICNTPNNEIKDIDDVTYRPHSSMDAMIAHPWDALVYCRWPEAVAHPLSAETKAVLFWAHDLMHPISIGRALAADQGEGFSPPDVWVSLSNFQDASHYLSSLPFGLGPIWEQVERVILPNGLDLSLYNPDVVRDPNKLIWTSNPNRGLANAVRIFRRLRTKYPDLELHVYGRSAVYGWNAASDPAHETAYLPVASEPHVYLHDPLPKDLLAKELSTAFALLYPSTWPETFCIAATEAMAAGTPVIAPPYGALPETIPYSLSWDFPAMFEELQDPKEWMFRSLLGLQRTRGLDWDHLALDWLNLIVALHKKREVYRDTIQI